MPVIYRSNPPERGAPRTLHPEVPAKRASKDHPAARPERASKDEAPRARPRRTADRLYDFLAAIARNGAPCPSADNIVEALGLNNTSDMSRHLDKLVAAGRIRVHRPGPSARVVEIVATGDRTAPTAPRTYSRRTGTRRTS